MKYFMLLTFIGLITVLFLSGFLFRVITMKLRKKHG